MSVPMKSHLSPAWTISTASARKITSRLRGRREERREGRERGERGEREERGEGKGERERGGRGGEEERGRLCAGKGKKVRKGEGWERKEREKKFEEEKRRREEEGKGGGREGVSPVVSLSAENSLLVCVPSRDATSRQLLLCLLDTNLLEINKS